jgi:uncharacterized iron-regulated membrane protein
MRHLWMKAHRWLGLCCGWLLVLVGISGAVLIVARPLDQLIHPQLFIAHPNVTAITERHPLQYAQEVVRTNFGKDANFTLRPPRNQNQTLWVLVRSPAWNGTLYLNPVTGNEQGRRGENEGIVNLLFKFHSSLFLKELGKAVLAWVALSYLALFITGIVLWWPKNWNGAFRFEMGKGLRRQLFNMHRMAGAFCGVMIVISISTGAYLAWRPLAGLVTALAGEKLTQAPVIGNEILLPKDSLALDELVHRAQEQFPNNMIGYIQVPMGENRPIRVRLKLADDPHPNGLTSIWLHPVSGEILAINRWDELDLGTRALSFVYPLHTGEFGGILLEFATLIGGLALGVLGVTGFWLWWSRTKLLRSKGF